MIRHHQHGKPGPAQMAVVKLGQQIDLTLEPRSNVMD